MTIIWTLNCFFMLYTWPTKQVFCLYLRRILDNKSFWMSLKLTFLAFKKVVHVVQIWGRRGGDRGGRGVIWTKSKRTAAFFGMSSLIPSGHLLHQQIASGVRAALMSDRASTNFEKIIRRKLFSEQLQSLISNLKWEVLHCALHDPHKM